MTALGCSTGPRISSRRRRSSGLKCQFPGTHSSSRLLARKAIPLPVDGADEPLSTGSRPAHQFIQRGSVLACRRRRIVRSAHKHSSAVESLRSDIPEIRRGVVHHGYRYPLVECSLLSDRGAFRRSLSQPLSISWPCRLSAISCGTSRGLNTIEYFERPRRTHPRPSEGVDQPERA
jgi:hypothetical protein